MSRSEAYIVVDCDNCGFEEEVGLIALAIRDAWDARNVDKELKIMGWTGSATEGIDVDFCPECSRALEDEEDT